MSLSWKIETTVEGRLSRYYNIELLPKTFIAQMQVAAPRGFVAVPSLRPSPNVTTLLKAMLH
jgi:hypothetical protein